MIDNCPWCGDKLVESEVKKSGDDFKYVTWYCDNKDCKRGFSQDVEVE